MACEIWDLKRLDTGDRSELKRCVGTMLGGNMVATEAFYRALLKQPFIETEDRIFAAMCMECMWHAEDVHATYPIEEMLRRIYWASTTTPSTQKKIVSLLDIAWGKDGFLLGKLTALVKRMRAEDGSIMPDFEKLAEDLVHWNSAQHYVQRRWIRTICLAKNADDKENVEVK